MPFPRLGMMRRILLRFVVLAAALAVPAGGVSAQGFEAGDGSPPTRVLFVGNSYLYYNDSLHNHVRRMVSELRPDIADQLKYKSSTIGGARLRHHDIEWLLEAGRIGVARPFEVVVMQGGSAEVLSDTSRRAFYATAEAYAARVRAAGGRPFLYMTHAYVPPHRRARVDLIDDIASAYLEAGKRADARVIPVGLAFAESYRRRPEYALHKAFDGTHPNLQGTYLAACVVLLSLYGESLDHLAYDYYGALSGEDIAYLKGIATEVSQRFAASSSGPR